ncbi:MAG: HIT domain-containing protein [Solobacterium sp.]|jgi:histidine triad (HIT) family protein|nr:HIT domain-containing protein [Solobacterium sp.]MBR3347400.1 HIT domain-containing protein [Solobacterium sp.]
MCIFCDIIDHKIPSSVVYEDDHTLAILDISQVTRGHTIVMPKKHCANILEADEETVQQVTMAAKKVAALLAEKTGCAGINLLNNCGEAAGQTVNHLHVHVIPRYGEADALEIHFKPSENVDLNEVLAQLK